MKALAITAAVSLVACAATPPPLKVAAATAEPAPQKLPAAEPAPDAGFDRNLSLSGVAFRVRSTNAGSLNQLRIDPRGLEGGDHPIEREIDGTVTNAEVADLNGDGSPEIYVYVTSAGSGSYGSLIAYAANRRKSLSEISMPELMESREASKGYRGHDEFRIAGKTLLRRFPVYRDADTNLRPTGGTRQIQYTLQPGEAGWILRAEPIANH